MDIKTYQFHALETMTYPDDDIALDCTLAGLAGEMGEIFELWKKFRRGDYNHNGEITKDSLDWFKKQTTKEMGDLFWYMVVYAWLWDIDLDVILQTNIDKLAKRQQNGTLHSSDRKEV